MPSPDPDQPIFEARLHPHRSLTRGQFRVLLAAVAAVGICASMPFVIMGAWPVAGFFGLDVLMVYLAFSASFRAARAYEDLVLTPLELLVAKVSAKGHRAEWRFNPNWVRLEREDHDEFGTQRLALVSRGLRLELAAFLGPDAKADLAGRLSRALEQARRGLFYS